MWNLWDTSHSWSIEICSPAGLLFSVEGVDVVRRDRLIDLLDINLQWRMHKVSDGQRRRVQICMGLLHPFQVLLLDEITVDLDVVARMDLLSFFVDECEEVGGIVSQLSLQVLFNSFSWFTHDLNQRSKI
jgi:CCR4-NOT complex subunit CAF16